MLKKKHERQGNVVQAALAAEKSSWSSGVVDLVVTVGLGGAPMSRQASGVSPFGVGVRFSSWQHRDGGRRGSGPWGCRGKICKVQKNQ